MFGRYLPVAGGAASVAGNITAMPELTRCTRRDFAQRLLDAAGLLALPPLAGAARAAPAGGPDVVRLSNAMLAMRDGVHLATDIYLPGRAGRPREGRFPVILERTPYD